MFSNLLPLKFEFIWIAIFQSFVLQYYTISKAIYTVGGNVISLLVKSGLSFIALLYLSVFKPS